MRASKDLAKRLRFDHRPRGDGVRRWYMLVSVGAVIAAVAAWQWLGQSIGQKQYSPGPVLAAHAVFGDRCEKCHAGGLSSVSNDTCQNCHRLNAHSEFESSTPECESCHVEHRGPHDIEVAATSNCVACHGNLMSKRAAPIAKVIDSFAAHPEFAPVRSGADHAALRFNHRVHLSSARIPESDKLQCASCHQRDDLGERMRPIQFANHCQRCHQQKPPNAIGAITALHAKPAEIRTNLQAQLLVLAAESPERLFAARPSALPGVAPRAPLAAAASLQEFATQGRDRLETSLYQPFDNTPPLLEHNQYCFLCHVQKGERAEKALPELEETKIPKRWLSHARFAHQAHAQVACDTCHSNVKESALTGEVNLPARDVCQRCHIDGKRESAGTQCSLCHPYHRGADEARAREVMFPSPASLASLAGEG